MQQRNGRWRGLCDKEKDDVMLMGGGPFVLVPFKTLG